MKKFIYISLFTIVVVLFSSYLYVDYKINESVEYNTDLEIHRNVSLRTNLSDLEMSKSPIFRLYLKYARDSGKKVKSGYYELKGFYNMKEIMDILEKGMEKTYKLRIVEGSRVADVIDELVSLNKIKVDKMYSELKNMEFPYPTPNNNFEGYFYPETYYIPEKADEKMIIGIILGEFLKKFPPEEYKDKDEFYEKLIMGSIIEREVAVEKEKNIVSSVFHNRLKKGMKLEVDSTVNFVFEYKKKRIYYKDLKVDSPYNTYLYKGLPPGPIGNPTRSSVVAAYNPVETDYLFFVTKGGGEHYFSRTYKEHLEFQNNNKKK